MDSTEVRGNACTDRFHHSSVPNNEFNCMNTVQQETGSHSINLAEEDFVKSTHRQSPEVDNKNYKSKSHITVDNGCSRHQYGRCSDLEKTKIAELPPKHFEEEYVSGLLNSYINETLSDNSQPVKAISDSSRNSSFGDQKRNFLSSNNHHSASDWQSAQICSSARNNCQKDCAVDCTCTTDQCCTGNNPGSGCCDDKWTKVQYSSTSSNSTCSSSDKTYNNYSDQGPLSSYRCGSSCMPSHECDNSKPSINKRCVFVDVLDIHHQPPGVSPLVNNEAGCLNHTESAAENKAGKSKTVENTGTCNYCIMPQKINGISILGKENGVLNGSPVSPSSHEDHLMFKSIPNLCYTNKVDNTGDITCSTLNLLHSSIDNLSGNVNFDDPPADTVSLPADVRDYAKQQAEEQHCQCDRGTDEGCDRNEIITAHREEGYSTNNRQPEVYQRSFSEPGLVRQRRMQIYGIAQRRKRIWYRRKAQARHGSITTSVGEGSEEESSFSLKKLSRSDKFMLLCLFISNVCSMMCLSVLAPFFPAEALIKGVDQKISGWIFGIFALTEVLVSPIFGKLVKHVSPRFMFLSGQFFAGCCYILFGLLQYVPTSNGNLLFIVLCFLLRIFTAVGCSSMATASFTIIAFVFGDHLSTVFGLLETATGLGLSLGPALGGVLFDVGGFMLPFVSLGSFMVVLVPITWCLLPNTEEEDTSSVSQNHITLLKLIRIPTIFVTCICTFVAAVVWATPDPVLSLHLASVRGYDLSSTMIGLMFLLLSACYGIFCPIWGWLCDKLDNSTPMLIVGFLLSGLGVMLLGPSPYFGLGEDYNELWLNIVALIVMGVALSLAIVPTFDKIVDAAEKAGFEESMETYGTVAGVWASCYALGDFAGPTVGGMLTANYTFPWCMTFLGYCCGAMAFIVACLWIYEKQLVPVQFLKNTCSCCKRQKQSGHRDTYSNDEEETKSLLDDQRTRYGTDA